MSVLKPTLNVGYDAQNRVVIEGRLLGEKWIESSESILAILKDSNGNNTYGMQILPSSSAGDLTWTLFPEQKSYRFSIKTDGMYYISRDFSTTPNIYIT